MPSSTATPVSASAAPTITAQGPTSANPYHQTTYPDRLQSPPSPTRQRSFTTTSSSTTNITPAFPITPSFNNNNNNIIIINNNNNTNDINNNDDLSPPDLATPPTSSAFLRKLSPGLAARMKLLDSKADTKNLPTLSRNRTAIGRIPQEHIQELDSAQRRILSIKIERRGRAWSQNLTSNPQPNLNVTTPPLSDGSDVQTDESEYQFPSLDSRTLPELNFDAEAAMRGPDGDGSAELEKRHLNDNANSAQVQESDLEPLSSQSSPDSDLGPPVPAKDAPVGQTGSSEGVESYFNPYGMTRTNSIYSLSRVSFNSQLSQLTSLILPDASSLSASISAIPTAPAAVKALIGAAEQMQKWIQKATEVLGGMNAEDDIEWAGAGREGLEDVDKAVTKFESLVGVYVEAIEELQTREDIADASAEELEAVVAHMEKTLREWEAVKNLMKGVKEQVELAMEWEELWSVVLGDVGMEMDNLSRLIFEMEEKRHKTITAEADNDSPNGVDINELETIVEESPSTGRAPPNYRFSLPPSFASTTSVTSPGPAPVADDSNLLALFARMQPLRASLDFLPMRLSMFQSRAESIFPTACEELETRRKGLEKGWKRLEADAEALRRELGEDRWVLVFRNAGRQAQKMCESVERSINKLQEALDAGTQHSNPAAVAKKIESFEAKKMHYGSAIERVLGIIQKGVHDRLTVNGEIIRLHSDMSSRWTKLAERIKQMDQALEEESTAKHQQLRDSISSIISMDRSAATSAVDTPGSSPASSVVLTGTKGDSTPSLNGSTRRGSSTSNQTARSRHTSMPPSSGASSHLPRLSSAPRAVTTSHKIPSPSQSTLNGTPRPSSRLQRPSASPASNRPRWNSSPNTNDLIIGHNFKPLSSTTPSPYRRLTPVRTPRSGSAIPLPSPLSREASSSPAPSNIFVTSTATRRQSQIPSSSPLASRKASPSPAPTGPARAWAQQQARLESTAAAAAAAAATASTKQKSPLSSRRSSCLKSPVSLDHLLETKDGPDDVESSPSVRPKSIHRPPSRVARPLSRPPSTLPQATVAPKTSGPTPSHDENKDPAPKTSRAGKRLSMLPQPKGRGGRESALGGRVKSGSWMGEGSDERPPWRG